jgi:Ca2+-binding EF-hand superfamily protein
MKLKKEAIKIFINHQMTQGELENLNTAFKCLDKDGNGELEFFEVLEALDKVGMQTTEEELMKVFKIIHGDDEKIRNPKKLKINYSEFISAALDLKKYLN